VIDPKNVPLRNGNPKLQTLFFAGTDTDVGKTFTAALVASALLARRLHQPTAGGTGHRIGVYKPVASGCRRQGDEWIADDARTLWQAAGCPGTEQQVCPQKFAAPLAPPQAARQEGRSVDPVLLREGARCWEASSDVLIVEGAGGLMSPLAEGILNIDLAKQFDQAKLIIVAANRLGAIHQTLATCIAAEHAGLIATGIILCQVSPNADAALASNASEIVKYTTVPVIATLPYQATIEDAHFADQLLLA